MNDEEAFQTALDANPDDHLTRAVFADWLDDRDDPRGPGYRELARRNLRPVLQPGPVGMWGWTVKNNWFIQCYMGGATVLKSRTVTQADVDKGRRYVVAGLPTEWFAMIESACRWKHYTTRRAAENAAARAWAELHS